MPKVLFIWCGALALLTPVRAQARAVDLVNLERTYEERLEAIGLALSDARRAGDEARYRELSQRYRSFPLTIQRKIQDALVVERRSIPRGHGLYWLYHHGNSSRIRNRALDELLARHGGEQIMAKVCARLCDRPTERDVTAALERLTRSPHREVRGRACFALARHLVRRRRGDPERNRRRAIVFYERVVREYADLSVPPEGTLGPIARNEVYELRHLRVGARAPEIVGKDLNGVPFRLSDYRGKVILLHFWGHW